MHETKGMGPRLLGFVFLVLLPMIPFLFRVSAGRYLELNPKKFESNLSISELTKQRTSLLVSLDLLVRAERTLQANYGSYTKAIGQVPNVLGAIASQYQIEILRANQNQLLISAAGGRRQNFYTDQSFIVGDKLTINEQFEVVSNFPLPDPPEDYLKTLAKAVLRQIGGSSIPDDETLHLYEGVFQDYFKYELRTSVSAQGATQPVAIGVKAPVLGLMVEVDQEDTEKGADLFAWYFKNIKEKNIQNETRTSLDHIYLAQQIRYSHTKTYATSIAELVPYWNSLALLNPEEPNVRIHEMQLDPAFGFYAEVGGRKPASTVQNKMYKVWSINGYGQTSELSLSTGETGQFRSHSKDALDIDAVGEASE